MHTTANQFKTQAKIALKDQNLQRALGNIPHGFIDKRARARAALPEFDALCDQAREIKDHVLAHLDLYLERYEKKVQQSGGQVHWCEDADAARQKVLQICKAVNARTITKGKTMISEEIELNDFLEKNGYKVVETDLGEYIIQLRREKPSHIIAPAIHLNAGQIETTFRAHHTELDPAREFNTREDFVAEARALLRKDFIAADVGITGANFLVAETGTSIIVTNEGNGDLTQTLPGVHIVLASLEKIVPTLEDATTFLRLLARSATGQDITTYTSFATGPRRPGDPDGPDHYHVILLDNGRSNMIGGEFQDMLRCIRCGACLNHCPVYQAVGGHAYGSVYPGPMGAVLTPALSGIDKAGSLPNASSFCGRCEAVCPVQIPLPKLMRQWRVREFEAGKAGLRSRAALTLWGFLARHPGLYHPLMGLIIRIMSTISRHGILRWLPLVGGWTRYRDFPAPQGKTFHRLWRRRK